MPNDVFARSAKTPREDMELCFCGRNITTVFCTVSVRDIFAKLINDVKDHIGHSSAVEILRNVLIRREKGQNLSLFLQWYSHQGTCMSLHYDILAHSDHVSPKEFPHTLSLTYSIIRAITEAHMKPFLEMVEGASNELQMSAFVEQRDFIVRQKATRTW